MPISFFLGPPRTGKTYEAVLSKIVPACGGKARRGKGNGTKRRVVTNVPLNEEALRAYTGNEGLEVIQVSLAMLQDPESYPWDPEGVYIPGKIVMPGDLVVIDEAHVVFPADMKLHNRITAFFRVHGHFYNDDTGQTIDIVVITQDANTLRNEIKYLGEVYMKVKPIRGRLGGKTGRYKASYYTSVQCSPSDMVGKPTVRSIRSEVFALYKSFTHGKGGTTKASDSRMKLLSPGMILYFAFGLLCFGYGISHFATGGVSFLSSSNFKQGNKEKTNEAPRVRCYDAGMFIDGGWRELRADGTLADRTETGGPREGCADQGQRSALDLGLGGL